MRFKHLWILGLIIGTQPLMAGPEEGWGNRFFNLMGSAVRPVPMILEGRGPVKAAFTIFITGTEVRSPAETIQGLTVLRDLHGYPIHGLWIETQHIRFSPAEVLNLVALGNAAGFHTLVRTPSHARTDIQGYIDTGAGGLIIPVTDDPNQIREAFSHTFYSAWREAGFSPDLRNLQAMSPEALDRVDHSKVLAFMVESVAAVDRIDDLVATAAELCDKHKIPRSHIVFWMGPYDLRLNKFRLDGGVMKQPELMEYATESHKKVAEAVQKAGFSMGGHMPRLEAGKQYIEESGFRIFTIAGAADSAYNPGVPSTAELFKVGDEERGFFLKPAQLSHPEFQQITATLDCAKSTAASAYFGDRMPGTTPPASP